MRTLLLRPSQRGFTLLEAILVIVITGIVAGMVAVFIRSPIDAYVATERRAMLADSADTAARRMARELQAALPNSARMPGSGAQILEFVPIRTAGRYRTETGPLRIEDPLSFTSGTDAAFDVIGPAMTVPAGSSLVIYNLGITGADVYEGPPLTVRRTVTAGSGLSRIRFTSTGTPFPFPSPGNRFQIVGTPVAYAYEAATQTLWRYTGYAFQASTPANLGTLAGLSGATGAAVATHVSSCVFNVSNGPLQHNGLVSILLTLTQDGESVTLQYDVNVDNVP